MTILAAISVVFSLVVLARLRKGARVTSTRHTWPQVLLLRPVDVVSGPERIAICTPLDYAADVEHVVIGRVDPGIAGVRFLPTVDGAFNRKLGHLKHALSTLQVGSRTLVVADADVYVDGDLLRALVAPVADIVVAPPNPDAGGSLDTWAARALLAHTLHSFRALLTVSDAICGKAMAISAATQRELLALDDCVAEDLRLAERVRQRQGSIVVAETNARTLPSPGLRRFTRWMQALRAHRPLAFVSVPLFIAPLPLLLLAPWWAFVTAFAARALVARSLATQSAGCAAGAWYWFWLGEPLLLLAFAAALLKRDVRWREQVLTIGPGGRILAAVQR